MQGIGREGAVSGMRAMLAPVQDLGRVVHSDGTGFCTMPLGSCDSGMAGEGRRSCVRPPGLCTDPNLASRSKRPAQAGEVTARPGTSRRFWLQRQMILIISNSSL